MIYFDPFKGVWNSEGYTAMEATVVNNEYIHEIPGKDAIFMEYTGRKDNDGREIYEGDITEHGVVEFRDDLNWDSGGSTHPGFFFSNGYEYKEPGCLTYHVGFDNCTVQGNIYENPELVGGEDAAN
jgi:hypothetical protein